MSVQIQWPLTIFYDHSCPLCRSEMHNIKARDGGDVLRLVDASSAAHVQASYGERSQKELMTLLHARDAAGTWLVGVDAFEAIYGATDMAWVTRFLQLPLVGRSLRRLYPYVARNRYRLPSGLLMGLFDASRQRAVARAEHAAAAWQANRCAPDGACRFDPASASGDDGAGRAQPAPCNVAAHQGHSRREGVGR